MNFKNPAAESAGEFSEVGRGCAAFLIFLIILTPHTFARAIPHLSRKEFDP
jgi:hypothetical protein